MSAAEASRVADKVRSVLQDGHDRLLLDLGTCDTWTALDSGARPRFPLRGPRRHVEAPQRDNRLNALLVVSRLLPVFDCFDEEAEALASFDAQPVA